jgi:hypothetical protein
LYFYSGELIGQGTWGGALVSSVNLDNDMEESFVGSSLDVTYGEVRLLCFGIFIGSSQLIHNIMVTNS